ncbi:leucine zipper domain-containing protein [Pseudonocardia acidicola]|uniref:leucine zipper domain-containing protein n=1 Tax=Pseudonocardia acidicola TaxID=2724939 RepID=UPI001B7D04DF
MPHRNAPLTVEGRRRLCERVDRGRPIAHVAAEATISPQCLSSWYARWCVEGETGLHERSSRPQHSPNRTPVQVKDRIEQRGNVAVISRLPRRSRAAGVR